MFKSNTTLPAAFVGKAPKRLKRKTCGRPGFFRLPFVAGARTKTASPCWNVPATGGYFGGYETGEAMAYAFLKFLREEKDGGEAHWLTRIAISFMIRFEQESGTAMENGGPSEWSNTFDSLRGQHAGFFNAVSQWLAASAKFIGSNLDRIEEQDLVRRANAGLGFDCAAYLDSLSDEDEG